MANTTEAEASSFRDPSGYLFRENGVLYRFIAPDYAPHYELLQNSGLYETLVAKHLLIPHTEASLHKPGSYKVIQPTLIPFISYPYEWCFSQLKAAALATLTIQQLALEKGMTLKDASAYNIQWFEGKPVLIDTLSFEKYKEGQPWVAYRQFCQHFLAPLALMAYTDISLGTLSAQHIDGIPLSLASRLLPNRTRYSFGLGSHIHLHARSQAQHADTHKAAGKEPHLARPAFLALLQSLGGTVKKLAVPQQKTEWGAYYADTNYTETARAHKENLVKTWVKETQPKRVWDAGANDARFSQLVSAQGIYTIATDIDPVAIEIAYTRAQHEKDTQLLPLVIDLTSPSPAIGWENTERDAFLTRNRVDTTLALALIHHLAIAHNVPLGRIASLFATQTKNLIIEFVPKEDTNAQRLLSRRTDIFPSYTEAGFEQAFGKYFKLVKKERITESVRTLYFFERGIR